MEMPFLILLFTLLYVFIFFPAALMLVALVPGKRAGSGGAGSVDFLIAARNERRHIGAKITNTLASDYPAGKLRILVGSDGSTDGTDAEVLAADPARVRLLSFPDGTGKTRTINALAAEATADILMISDADVLIEPDAVKTMVAAFQDPDVGAVCARRSNKTCRIGSVGKQARLYNLYEGAIKKGEGRLGRVLGGNGSLYAIRRELFTELPSGAPDDFVSILHVLEQKRKVLYEDRAISREELPRSATREFQRRRRTTARALRGLWAARSLLNPLRFPLVSFLLLSHKILRWCGGLFMAGLLISNLLLIRQPPYACLFAAQVLFYAAAAIGSMKSEHPLWKPFRMARYFVLMNMAATAGIVDVIRHRDWHSWDVSESR